MQSTTTRARPDPAANARVERLQGQLAERDEIIVALQYVIRDLRHEIENLRAEQRFLARALVPRGQCLAVTKSPKNTSNAKPTSSTIGDVTSITETVLVACGTVRRADRRTCPGAPLEQSRAMTYEQAQEALLALARGHGGLITAADVESDEELASDQPTVSAAARAFAGSTNVFAVPREDEGWFPYSEIRITVL